MFNCHINFLIVDLDAPMSTGPSSDIEAELGTEATLNCGISGNPEPTYVWSFKPTDGNSRCVFFLWHKEIVNVVLNANEKTFFLTWVGCNDKHQQYCDVVSSVSIFCYLFKKKIVFFLRRYKNAIFSPFTIPSFYRCYFNNGTWWICYLLLHSLASTLLQDNFNYATNIFWYLVNGYFCSLVKRNESN